MNSQLLLLLLSLLPLVLGPFLAVRARRSDSTSVVTDAFVTISVLGITLIHILPDSFQLIGAGIFVVAPLGFALPWAIHQWWHHQHLANHKVVFGLALLGLTLHGAMDGIALFAPVSGTPHGHIHAAWLLALAVILHRLPMALAIWWLSRPKVGRLFAILLLVTLGLATLLGFAGAAPLWTVLSLKALATMQAFIAGMLFHIVLDHHGPASEMPSGRPSLLKARLWGILLGSLPLLGLSLLAPDWPNRIFQIVLLLGISLIYYRWQRPAPCDHD